MQSAFAGLSVTITKSSELVTRSTIGKASKTTRIVPLPTSTRPTSTLNAYPTSTSRPNPSTSIRTFTIRAGSRRTQSVSEARRTTTAQAIATHAYEKSANSTGGLANHMNTSAAVTFGERLVTVEKLLLESTAGPNNGNEMPVLLWIAIGVCAVVLVLIAIVLVALLLAYLCCPRKRVSRRLSGRRASVAFADAPAGARVVDPSRPRADAPVLLRVAGSYTPGVFMFDTSHSAQVSQQQHVQEIPPMSPSPSYSAAVRPPSAERIPDIYIEMAPAHRY